MGILDAPGVTPAAVDAKVAALATVYAPAAVPAGVSAAVKRFDPARGTYNEAAGSLRRARAAFASHTASPFTVLCFGDSTVLGANATPPQSASSWPSRLAQMIGSQEGKQASTGRVYFLNYSLSADPRLVFTGTWALANVGPFNNGGRGSNTNASTLVFTPDIPVTAFEVHYQTTSDGGQFTYAVDGGSTTAVNTNSGSNGESSFTVTGLTAAAHALTITVGATGYVRLISVEGMNGTIGTRVTRAGLAGAMASSALVGASIGAAGSIGTIAAVAPNLTIFGFGVNEYLQQVSVATYKANMTTLINTAKTAGSDVIVLVGIPNSDQTKTITQNALRQALFDLADTLDVCVIDIAYLWESYATSSVSPLALYGDVTHPNSKGYLDIAATVYAVITSGGRAALSAAAAGSVPATTYAADGFNGADGALTTTEVGGKTWTSYGTAGGTWARASGQLAASKLANATATQVAAAVGVSDGTVNLTLSSAALNNCLMFRWSSSSEMWVVGNFAGAYKLYKFVAGSPTLVGTAATVPTAGDVVAVTLAGSSISVKVNGTAVSALTASDSFNATATAHGAWVGGSSAQTALFDNFSVTA